MWTRRSILTSLSALPVLTSHALASPPNAVHANRRLVVLVLRGGLDGLAAVPAIGDPAFEALRGAQEGVMRLDETFGLHSALAPLAPLWEARELAAVHAVGLPYTGRSHFEAQDLLEGGGSAPHTAQDGWLGRAVAAAGGSALAVGAHVPLLLRGPVNAASLDPRRDLGLAADLELEVASLYAQDPLLGPALAQGLALRAKAEPGAGVAAGSGQARRLGEAVGKLLAPADGARVAVVELAGWDTHVGQTGALQRQLGELAGAILALRTTLGPLWSETAVVALTEFGRCAKLNGTGGTDHGSGGAALLAGGAVRGGRVIADWPGLAPGALLEARDLRPTLDLRALEKAICIEVLGLDPDRVEREVFPGSAEVAPLVGVFA